MIIQNKNGEFNLSTSQYIYLTHTFNFNEIDSEIVSKTNFIKSSWEYKKAHELLFNNNEKYRNKLKRLFN